MRKARISSAGKIVGASNISSAKPSAQAAPPNPPTIPAYIGHPDYTFQTFRDNFYSQWSVSAALPNEETRNMGWGIPNNGYDWFFDTYIMPDIAKGVKKFHIHLPHGKEQGGPMSYDALLEAQEDGDTFAYERFYERIAEIYQSHPDVVFLCYYGTLRYDPDIKPLLETAKIDEWITRLVDSILPAIKAPNIDIGFDASYGPPDVYGPDHPNFHFLSLIRSLKQLQGRTVYGEPKPHMDATWWHDFPCLVIETFWHRSNPEKHSDASGAYIEQLTGPCLRMEVRGYRDENGNKLPNSKDIPDWRTWYPQQIATILFKDTDRYGFKFQVSRGTVRILNHENPRSGHGPEAESLREVYELAIDYAVEQGWLAPWKDDPQPEPEIVPELRYETLEELSEDQRKG